MICKKELIYHILHLEEFDDVSDLYPFSCSDLDSAFLAFSYFLDLILVLVQGDNVTVAEDVFASHDGELRLAMELSEDDSSSDGHILVLGEEDS